MLEKVVSIFGLIFVTSFVAKYVGPKIFGEIAFAVSIFQIVQVLSQLGSDVLIFKRTSKKILSGILLINATFSIRIFIYLIVSLPILYFFYEKYEFNDFLFIFSIFVSCFFLSIDVVSIFNDARLQSKQNTVINVIGLIVSLVIRWLIPYMKLQPVLLCIPIILTSMLPFFIRIYFYRHNFSIKSLSRRNAYKYKKYIVLCGSSLVISSLSVAIYPRLGMLILGV